MKNTYSVMVPSCYGVKLARKSALRSCVMKSSLYPEFRKGSYLGEDVDHFSKRMDDFIQEKKLRITEERIIPCIDGDRYVADVYFTVAW